MSERYRNLAGKLAASRLCARGAALWQENQANWNLPLSTMQKLAVGVYLILRDYQQGLFPPVRSDRATHFASEIAYGKHLPGFAEADLRQALMRKPFWSPAMIRKYLSAFIHIADSLARCGITPPQQLLELGGGDGWLAEFLALTGFDVVSTTLALDDTQAARQRQESLRAKGLPCKLDFKTAPMESVNTVVAENSFDAVFVFEALHHAFDWKAAMAAAFTCLKPGGWFLLFNEPNLIHTFAAFRVARLSHTSEIGFLPAQLIAHLRSTGFQDVRYLKNQCHFWCRHISLAGRKPV